LGSPGSIGLWSSLRIMLLNWGARLRRAKQSVALCPVYPSGGASRCRLKIAQRPDPYAVVVIREPCQSAGGPDATGLHACHSHSHTAACLDTSPTLTTMPYR
jgi:hypothetical protein